LATTGKAKIAVTNGRVNSLRKVISLFEVKDKNRFVQRHKTYNKRYTSDGYDNTKCQDRIQTKTAAMHKKLETKRQKPGKV